MLFGIWRHPDLTHAQFDAQWRDVHAPLALEHHPAMWDYTKGVVNLSDGPADYRDEQLGAVIQKDVDDVEDLLAERGGVVSYESIRRWCLKFGPGYTAAAEPRGHPA